MKPLLVARPNTVYPIRRLIGRLVLMIALLALPAMTWAQPMMTKWDRDHPLPARLGPFSLSSSRTPTTSNDNAILHVTDTQGRKTDIKIEIAYDDVYASLGVGRIDPDSPNPQLLITSFTGGAHCCVHIRVLDLVAGQWRTVDLGALDGDPFSVFPADIDGDGITDIQLVDDRFAYEFGCYACSWMPPRVFNVRGGKVEDVSAAPRYRALYVRDFRGARKQCREHVNAACAGLVADGYRLGRSAEAWSVAMANIDPKDGWLPGCKVKETDGQCPEGKDFHAGEFREALTQFLIEIDIAPTGG